MKCLSKVEDLKIRTVKGKENTQNKKIEDIWNEEHGTTAIANQREGEETEDDNNLRPEGRKSKKTHTAELVPILTRIFQTSYDKGSQNS